MKRLAVIWVLLGAACSGEPASDAGAGQGNSTTASTSALAAQSTGLAGLYEGGSAPRRNQLCVTQDGDTLRFGLVVWGAGQNSCSGIGTATRDRDMLRLAMAGDEACRIDATVGADGAIMLPARTPAGCAYYCGAGASLADVRLERAGGGAEAARRARDLVGEPLCGAQEGS